MNNYPRRGAIVITNHAMMRLKERVQTHEGFRNWKRLAAEARYAGKTPSEMDPKEKDWVDKRISRRFKRSQIRAYRGFAWIFMGNNGHARTLVTVIKMDDIMEE